MWRDKNPLPVPDGGHRSGGGGACFRGAEPGTMAQTSARRITVARDKGTGVDLGFVVQAEDCHSRADGRENDSRPLIASPVRSELDAEENNQPRILLGTFLTRYEPSDILMDRSVPPDLAPGHFWGILRRRIGHAVCSDAVGQAGVSSDYHSSLRCSRSCAWPRLTTGRQGGPA